ncbi:TetR/AcrR family transcriptional regulator [Niveispirillum fermenti]|uniref:TetR/AcrR family transcriptional regulator n=1 Tax=Niveispirillum fermenti TaxID=1233113 RepID=UPI003A8990E5
MPAVVDHEACRRAVAEATAELITCRGIDAVTVRDVARAAGYSTAIISHLFTSRADLLSHTYRSTLMRARQRMEAALTAPEGGGLRGYLAALLPLTADQRGNWRVWVTFWSMAIANPAFAAEQKRVTRQITDRLAALLADHGLDEAQARAGARRLLILVHGVATQAFFDRDHWPAEEQWRLLDRELTAIGLPPVTGGQGAP